MAIKIPIISEFDGKGIKKAIKQFKELEGAAAKTKFAFKKLAPAAAASFAGITTAAVAFAKAAAEDQQGAAQLALALKNTTDATQTQIGSVEKWITSTSMATATADDELRPALARLSRATGDLTRAQKLVTLGQDISAATGRDLESVTTALAKAEMGNYNALKKLGIPLGENAQAQLDMAAASKQVTKAQSDYDALVAGGASHKEVAKAVEKLKKAQDKLNRVTVKGADYAKDLEKKFKGANKTFADSAAGGFKRMGIALQETKESIGSALLPVVQAVLPYLMKFAQWAQDNPTTFKIIALTIAGIAGSIMLVNAAMALNPIGLAIIAVGLLAGAFATAWSKSERFRDIVKAVFKAVATFVIDKCNTIIDALNKLIDAANLVNPWADIKHIPKIEFGNGAPHFKGGFRAFEQATNLAPRISAPGVARRAEGATTITVHVNGADPNAVVQTLRKYVRQTGSLPVRTAVIG